MYMYLIQGIYHVQVHKGPISGLYTDIFISNWALSLQAKLIEFNPLKATNVYLPDGISFVISNSCVEMNKAATSEFNTRVLECRIATQVPRKKCPLPWGPCLVLLFTWLLNDKTLMKLIRFSPNVQNSCTAWFIITKANVFLHQLTCNVKIIQIVWTLTLINICQEERSNFNFLFNGYCQESPNVNFYLTDTCQDEGPQVGELPAPRGGTESPQPQPAQGSGPGQSHPSQGAVHSGRSLSNSGDEGGRLHQQSP